MSTFGTMKRRIVDEMVRGDLTATDSATLVARAVVDAIQYFGTRHTWFNEFHNSSHATTASSPYVTLSASVGEVQLISVKVRITANREYPLAEDGFQAIDRIDTSQYSGYPEVYAYYNGKLRMYPIPDSAYTVLMYGTQILPEVSLGAASAATNAWMTHGEQPIRLHAKGNLYRDYIRNPQEAGALYAEAERMFESQIGKRTRRLQSARRVRRFQW